MRKHVGIQLALAFWAALAQASTHAPNAGEREELTLTTAIAKANRNNPTLYKQRLTLELSELTYENAWAAMWLPSVNFQMNTHSPYTVTHLPNSGASNTRVREQGAPVLGSNFGSAQVNVGEFTLYNFGRDKDVFDKAQLEIERQRQILRETERQVRFDVIRGVFNLKTRQDLLEIAQRSVDSAQAIDELVKSRIPLGKATESDLSSAEVDLLNAKNALIQAQTDYNQALWALNITLGDPLGHSYKVKTSIKYIKFKMPLEDVIQVFKENAPNVKNARKSLAQAQLDLKIAEKNSLPLPKITFSGISIGHAYLNNGSAPVRTTTSDTSGNLDVGATLSFTIPLVGSGGFLNQRALRAAEISVEQAEIDLRSAGNQGESDVRNLYNNIVQLEDTINNNEQLFKNSLKVFETAVGQLQSRSGFNRLDLKDAIRQLREAEQSFTQSVLQHYDNKLRLAQAIGVDRFPEENL